MLVTKKNAVKLCQEVVNEWEDRLVKELDLPKVPIYVREYIGEPGTGGMYHAAYRTKLFDIFGTEGEYVHDKSNIELFPMTSLYGYLTKKIKVRLPITTKRFKRKMLESLAHELRHGHQHYHKTMEMRKGLIFQFLTPYMDRPEEKDAFKWSKEFVKEVLQMFWKTLKEEKPSTIIAAFVILGLHLVLLLWISKFVRSLIIKQKGVVSVARNNEKVEVKKILEEVLEEIAITQQEIYNYEVYTKTNGECS